MIARRRESNHILDIMQYSPDTSQLQQGTPDTEYITAMCTIQQYYQYSDLWVMC